MTLRNARESRVGQARASRVSTGIVTPPPAADRGLGREPPRCLDHFAPDHETQRAFRDPMTALEAAEAASGPTSTRPRSTMTSIASCVAASGPGSNALIRLAHP